MVTGRNQQQPEAPSTDGTPPSVVLHEERFEVRLDRVAVERVVLRRRIVTEVRQVEVTLRREELEVVRVAATGQEPTPAGPAGQPLVIVLSEEVPVIGLATRPYEQVVVHVDTVTTQQHVRAQVSREQADVEQTGPA